MGMEYACYLHHIATAIDDLAPASHLDVDAVTGGFTTGSKDRRVAPTSPVPGLCPGLTR